MNYFTYNIYIIAEKEHWDITKYTDYPYGLFWGIISESFGKWNARMLLWGAIQFGEVHVFEI